MSATITCPHCQGSIQNDPSLAGQVVSCPHCNQQFKMPQAAVHVVSVAPVKPAPSQAPSPAGEFDFATPSRSQPSSVSSRYQKRKKKPPVLLILGGGFGAMMLFCCGFGIVNMETPEETEQREAHEAEQERIATENAANAYKTEDHSTTAYGKARDAVKQRLKSPSTASFPGMWGGEWDAHTTRGPDGDRVTYNINSWVDAQNSFGATIRTHWSATVTQYGEDDYSVSIDSM